MRDTESFLAIPSQDPAPLGAAELLQSAYRYALALTHHPEDAEDLVQEGWMNLRRRYGCVESRAVLIVAVRNLFIDQCRHRKIVYFESLDVLRAADAPVERGAEPGAQGDLETLLGALRPAEREALFLHYYEGHTAAEIGQLTGRPRNTVLSILHRSIQKLRAAADSDPVRKQAIAS